MHKRLLLISLSLCLLFTASQARAAANSATAQVKAILDSAMDIQTKPDLQGEAHRKERAQLVGRIISENFLAGEMAQESLKGTWEKISQGQRSEYQKLFAILFQDSYTRMVLDFLQKETIEYRSESNAGGSVRVPTVIMRANEHIPVDYSMVQKNGRWFIRDVTIDGVSIVDNYRNTFRRVISSGSFDTLLQKMRLQSQAIE